MKNQFTLSVATPCSRDWDSFTTTCSGGFCDTCQIEVIDFTKMSDDQVIQYFTENKGRTCGRFKPYQLKSYEANRQPSKHRGLLHASFLGLSLLLLAGTGIVHAQSALSNAKFTAASIEQTEVDKSLNIIKVAGNVQGIVTDENSNPITGVNVYLKGDETVGTTTDVNGKFNFPKALNEGDVLIFQMIGFETQEYILSGDVPANIEIQLWSYIELLGEVVVDEVYEEKPEGKNNFWNKIKNLF